MPWLEPSPLPTAPPLNPVYINGDQPTPAPTPAPSPVPSAGYASEQVELGAGVTVAMPNLDLLLQTGSTAAVNGSQSDGEGGVSQLSSTGSLTQNPVIMAPEPAGALTDRDRTLWNKVLRPNLKGPLWTSASADSACSLVMVPEHAAFAYGEETWLDQLEDQFRRFTAAATDPNTKTPVAASRLPRLMYYHLASRYLVLAQRKGAAHRIPPGLADLLRSEIEADWETVPAWQWDYPSFVGGMRERLSWKLANASTPKSYHRAIIDEDLLLIGIAADLRTYERLIDSSAPASPGLQSILDETYAAFLQEIQATPGGGWLLQPGVWSDHPEYAFAGQTEKRSGLGKAPVSEAAWDSSHFTRMPVVLRSLIEAHAGSARGAYYDDLRRSLDVQLFDRVLVPPTGDFPWYRATNFMDGRNGIYRWGYANFGENGYGPFELSGSLLVGWWTFLDSDRIRQVYESLASSFPLPLAASTVYAGPATGAIPSYNDGARELLSSLAYKIHF